MRIPFNCKTLLLFTLVASAATTPALAALISNGGFESGLTGWTVASQVGSEGAFMLQTGTTSPVNLLGVQAPPEGTTAAMTDAEGPGSHILYQDFVVPAMVPVAIVQFSLYVNNRGSAFFNPASLDFSTPTLNQQARVDILKTSADPFSVAPADILQSLYQSMPGDSLVSGYTSFGVDVTSLLQAHPGETLRLRFAEVDNVQVFNLGVDAVDVNMVPEPSTWVLACGALLGLKLFRRQMMNQAARPEMGKRD